MRHVDLFSGILGFSLAAEWVWGDEYELVLCCESDPFCQKVIRKHRPGVPIVEDVRDVNKILAYAKLHGCNSSTGEQKTEGVEQQPGREKESRSPKQSEGGSNGREISEGDVAPESDTGASTNVDLLTGGFPCQGFSVAGKQRGKADERYLWPEMFEVIKATRPRWVIGENVNGIINMALDTVLSDLEGEGYATQPFIIPACAQNAPHRRDRVWVVAHFGISISEADVADPRNKGLQGSEQRQASCEGERTSRPVAECSEDVADTENPNRWGANGAKDTGRRDSEIGGQGEPSGGLQHGISQSQFCRILDGLSQRLDPNQWDNGEWEGVPRVAVGVKDRVNKLKALGNAIVPQIVMPIMQAIKEINENNY